MECRASGDGEEAAVGHPSGTSRAAGSRSAGRAVAREAPAGAAGAAGIRSAWRSWARSGYPNPRSTGHRESGETEGTAAGRCPRSLTLPPARLFFAGHRVYGQPGGEPAPQRQERRSRARERPAAVLTAGPAFAIKRGRDEQGMDHCVAGSPGVHPRCRGVLWRTEAGLLFEAHHMFSIVLGPRPGVYDRTAANIGYAWKQGKVGFGPSVSVLSVPCVRIGSVTGSRGWHREAMSSSTGSSSGLSVYR
jgi:hypothetical protein